MSYQIKLKYSLQKQLRKLPYSIGKRMTEKIVLLAKALNTRDLKSKRLKGQIYCYLCVGSWQLAIMPDNDLQTIFLEKLSFKGEL